MKSPANGRLLTIAVCALLSASAAQTADKPAVNETQLPRQVLPTGAEDAAQAAPAGLAARSAVATVSSEADQLSDELAEAVSESDEGLTTVTLPDGSQMVN